MLVLLPPSESKRAAPRRGRPVDLAALAFPELSEVRDAVLTAAVKLAGQPDAAARLGLPPSLAADAVAKDAVLREAPALPVHALYTGVLYDALGWESLGPGAKRRGARRIVVASALWGALRMTDRVPPYRLPMDADLPGLGPLAATWRQVLEPALAHPGLVVDCRSGPYVAAAPLRGPRTVAVRVLREHEGRRTVVSHMAKHTRGLVARHLLETGQDPRRPEELAEALRGRRPVELRPGTLDVVVAE